MRPNENGADELSRILGLANDTAQKALRQKQDDINADVAEESARAGASGPGFAVHTDIIVPYISSLGTDEQKQRWLPGCVSATSSPRSR